MLEKIKKMTAEKNQQKIIKHNEQKDQIENKENINSQKNTIYDLNKQINYKNDTIKNYSVDNKLINQKSNNYKNLLKSQMNINKNQNNQIRNLEGKLSDFSIKKKEKFYIKE